MGRSKGEDGNRLGPKIWARFLMRHFQCDLDELNAQLPLPIEQGELFHFGKNPAPLPRRASPRLFQRSFELGSTPDGCYSQELYDDKARFNLYQRVVQRVPESAHWLLKDLAPFLEMNCPKIDFSAEVCDRLSAELGVMLIDDKCLQAWEQVDSRGLGQAEASTRAALVECPLPETLALLFALYHVAVWQGVRSGEPVGRLLEKGCLSAAQQFGESPVLTHDAREESLGFRLLLQLEGAVRCVRLHGGRSMLSRPNWNLIAIPSRLIMFEDCQRNRDAMRCLRAGGDFFWEELFEPSPTEFCPDGLLPTAAELSRAAAVLGDSANKLKIDLACRASMNLGGYREPKKKWLGPVREAAITSQRN